MLHTPNGRALASVCGVPWPMGATAQRSARGAGGRGRPFWILLPLVAGALWTIVASPAWAYQVTFSFETTVVSLDPELSGTFSVGQTFSGWYTFESLTPDANESPNRGWYNGAITALSVTVGNYTATATYGDIHVWNDRLYVGDSYVVTALNVLTGPNVVLTGANIAELPPHRLLIGMNGGYNHFDSDALPVTPPDPSGFDLNSGSSYIWLSFGIGGNLNTGATPIYGLEGAVPISLVPEPSTAILIGFGLVGLLAVGRRLAG